MVTAHNGNVALAFEQVGDDGGEPLLLIMGLGMQMIYWPEGCSPASPRRDSRWPASTTATPGRPRTSPGEARRR
jgi:hypothetical protein